MGTDLRGTCGIGTGLGVDGGSSGNSRWIYETGDLGDELGELALGNKVLFGFENTVFLVYFQFVQSIEELS